MNLDLRYPIGPYIPNNNPSTAELSGWIRDIESFPSNLIGIVKDLKKDQLNWTYRPGSWTIKQVVHHCADSHMNSLIRFKWALTEDEPIVKAYHEDRWAKLADSNDSNLDPSLELLTGLHKRWIILLISLDENDLNKSFIHPENNRLISLKENIGNYAWHCKHHFAHIEQAILSNSQSD